MRNKEDCIQRVNKLCDVFNGNKQLDNVEKNLTLETWFKEISKHIESLAEDDGKKIMQLLQALEEVQGNYQNGNGVQFTKILLIKKKI